MVCSFLRQASLIVNEDTRPMRFEHMRQLFNAVEYGHFWRILIGLLAQTGMRPSIARTGIGEQNFEGDIVWFLPGKNQKKKPRRIRLDPRFMAELEYYKKYNATCAQYIFMSSSHKPVCETYFTDYFNKVIRPQLKGVFLEQRVTTSHRINTKREYIQQLSGIRKTYQLKIFWEYLLEFPAQIVKGMVARDMKHSSYRITEDYYLATIKYIQDELEKYQDLTIADILYGDGYQARLQLHAPTHIQDVQRCPLSFQ